MSEKPEIVVVGSHAPGLSVRVDHVPVPGETVIGVDFQEPVDGGKGSNQAIAAARLGAKVSFVGCVGKDRIGDEGERWMREAGVDTSHLRRSEHVASGVGFILLMRDGVPAMVTSMGANAELTREDVDTSLQALRGARFLLTQFEIPRELALTAASVAHRMGMVTIVNPAPAIERGEQRMDYVDILVPNETEAKVLLGEDPAADLPCETMARSLWARTGARCVIITLGKDGLVGIDQDGRWFEETPSVSVLDTSGAGDVFCAALAVRMARGALVREASNWACQAASLSVTRLGTIPAFPTTSEVETFILESGGGT